MGKLVFLGTPAFAVPSLERLIAAGHRVEAVFTQPDRPNASPVKQAALHHGLTVHQPERIRRPESIEQLRAILPDAMVVVGYGQIIPQNIIDIPALGIVNVHASLLPKYRGAAPIQWAIANGEERTGVTTMRIDAGLDTGDMLLKWATAIGPEENALQLGERLAEAGAKLLVETLAQLGTLHPEPQDSSQASLAPLLKKEDGRIDWSKPAPSIFNRARGFLPWPGAYSTFRNQLFHIWKAQVGQVPDLPIHPPGYLFANNKHLMATCGNNTILELLEVQLESRKRMSAGTFLNGHRLTDNEILGASHT